MPLSRASFSLRERRSSSVFSAVSNAESVVDIAIDATERERGKPGASGKERAINFGASLSRNPFLLLLRPFDLFRPRLLDLPFARRLLPRALNSTHSNQLKLTSGTDRLRHRRHQMGPRAPPGKGKKGHQGRPGRQARRHARDRRRRLRETCRRRLPADDVPDAQAQDQGVHGRGPEDAEHPGGREAEGEAVEGERRTGEGKRRGRGREGSRERSRVSLSLSLVPCFLLLLLSFRSSFLFPLLLRREKNSLLRYRFQSLFAEIGETRSKESEREERVSLSHLETAASPPPPPSKLRSVFLQRIPFPLVNILALLRTQTPPPPRFKHSATLSLLPPLSRERDRKKRKKAKAGEKKRKSVEKRKIVFNGGESCSLFFLFCPLSSLFFFFPSQLSRAYSPRVHSGAPLPHGWWSLMFAAYAEAEM
jgi:hypothetical protein